MRGPSSVRQLPGREHRAEVFRHRTARHAMVCMADRARSQTPALANLGTLKCSPKNGRKTQR